MRIGLLRHQQPFAEYDQRTKCWRVWYIFNNDVTSGTYYELSSDGSCDRVTVLDRDILHIDRVCSVDPDYEDAANEHAFLCNYSV